MAVSSLHIDVAGQQKQIPKPLLLETAKLLTLSREELAAEIRRQLDENPFLLAKEVETAPLSEPIQTPFDEPVGVSADFPGTTSLITWKNTPSEPNGRPDGFLKLPDDAFRASDKTDSSSDRSRRQKRSCSVACREPQ